MKTKPQTTAKALIESEWYELSEVAAKFGVHYSSAYDALKAGSIPHIKFGGRYKISKKWVDELPHKTVLEFQRGG